MLRLLTKDVTKRLGCLFGGAGDIRAHRFFRTVSFEDLRAKALPAPWLPTLASKLDTSHFDEYAEDDAVEPYVDDGSRGAWDAAFCW